MHYLQAFSMWLHPRIMISIQFQRDKMNNTNLYKPGVGIAPDVIKMLNLYRLI